MVRGFTQVSSVVGVIDWLHSEGRRRRLISSLSHIPKRRRLLITIAPCHATKAEPAATKLAALRLRTVNRDGPVPEVSSVAESHPALDSTLRLRSRS